MGANEMKLYALAMALNAVLLFSLAVLWEIELRPENPIVPLGLLIISFCGFYLASEEAQS
jgi:hypothetical protein